MSSYNVKPGVDWSLIKADFDSGCSIRECVRRQCDRGVKITKRAIEKRRDREGWDTKAQMALATQRLPSVVAQATGQSISRLRTPEIAQKILASLRTTPNYAAAAAIAGISRATLDEWRNAEPEFQELCDQAMALSAADDIEQIKNAGKRDWKASAYLAERNPATKADYAQKDSGTTINVMLNIDRAEPETITVNGTAEKP